MSFCLNCTNTFADNYVSCITCNNRLHYVCFHDAKLTKSKFPNNNSVKYLIEMFNSPFFDLLVNYVLCHLIKIRVLINVLTRVLT